MIARHACAALAYARARVVSFPNSIDVWERDQSTSLVPRLLTHVQYSTQCASASKIMIMEENRERELFDSEEIVFEEDLTEVADLDGDGRPPEDDGELSCI